jgi:RNA polymerase subunit RPABC4/transcription elongation factor Spt4
MAIIIHADKLLDRKEKKMDPRVFHGNLRPEDIARALVGEFNRGNLHAQQFGSGDQVIVQIATRDHPQSGGKTALSVHLQTVEDGVAVQIGKQAWLSVAASLGHTLFSAWLNPWNLLGRLDDVAQDIENLQLSEDVWGVIENYARTAGASFELSERLRRTVCEYCHTANPVGASNCIACGAPLGNVQPRTCSNCGFVLKPGETVCPNCGQRQ